MTTRLLTFFLVLGTALAQAPQFAVEGRVVYAASYSLGRWEGSNTSVRGSVRWNEQTGEASGRVCVDLRRFDSGNPLRDADGRGVFDVNRFPESCMDVERLARSSDEAVLSGNLEISGTRRPVRFVGRLTKEGDAYRFQGLLNTKFSEWNLKPPALLFFVVDDPVQIRLDARAAQR